MTESIMRHIKDSKGEKEYYTLMHVLSRYLYSMHPTRNSKQFKTHFYIGSGEPGLKRYGCSRFKIDCAAIDDNGEPCRFYEIIKKEKLAPSHQRRFDIKKKMVSDVYGRLLHTVTYAEINVQFRSWLFDELEDYRCADDAYPNIIQIIDDVAYQCDPAE